MKRSREYMKYSDYIFQDIPYEEQLERSAALIEDADMILIGAGAGTSTAAGRYCDFVEKMDTGKAVLLELDVGFNTAAIWSKLSLIYIANLTERRVFKMNRNKRTDIFLKKLKEDSMEYQDLDTTGYNSEEKKNTIRSLMNIRMPKELSDELVALQDDYLQEELNTKGIVTLSDIPTIKEQFGNKVRFSGKKAFLSERLSLWQGDITRLKVGAIVNAANSQMLGCFVPCHRCIDNAIHSAAGMQLRDECSRIMSRRRMKYGRSYEEPTGTATLTAGYNLPCDHVIHTVGPIVYDRLNDALCQDLQNCYENVLKCCLENNIKSVAFCCISTGEFHFPNDKAAEIALETVAAFLEAHDDCMERVIFNVFKDRDRIIYEEILG